MKTTIGSIIKAWREAEGFSQAGAAKKFGCSRSFLCQMEHGGKIPGAALAVRMERASKGKLRAKILRPDLAELLGG